MVTAVRPAPPPSPTPLSAFYSPYLKEEDRANYEVALTVNGLQNEIALLRLHLLHLCRDDPHDTPMCLRLTNAINRLIKTQRVLKQDEAVEAAIPGSTMFESLMERDYRHEAAPTRHPVEKATPRHGLTADASINKAEDPDAQAGIGEHVATGDSDSLPLDQNAEEQAPVDAAAGTSLPQDEVALLFSHGKPNERSRKKNKTAHSHQRRR